MATKIKKSAEEEEEELFSEENECRTAEARSKVVEIREKSRERNEDERRERALKSIHRMEWLKNKDDLSVLQRGTSKAKPRGRRKDRVEVVKNLQDLGLPSSEPPSARYATPPPPQQNAWSVKRGSALFPNTTATTIVTFELKDYDEEAMLKKALEESLACSEECIFNNPEEYEVVPSWAPNNNKKSARLAGSMFDQKPSRNDYSWVHGQPNNFGYTDRGQGNDLGHSIHGQWNDMTHSAHVQRNAFEHMDNRPRNDTDSMPEKNYQSSRVSPKMTDSFVPPDENFKEKDSNKIEKKDSNARRAGKTKDEGEPIDYFKKGKELAEKRARERALKFAAQEAEKLKTEKVAQETQENDFSKTEAKSSPPKNVRFSPDIGHNNNEHMKGTTQTLPDTRARNVRIPPEPERLTKALKVSEEAADHEPPLVPEEQRQIWTPKRTQMEPPPVEVLQPDSTILTPPKEASTANQTTFTQRLYTPEDFIVMDNGQPAEMPDLNPLSLSYGTGFDQYIPYMAYPYGVRAYPDIGVLPQCMSKPAAQHPNTFPGVTMSASGIMQPSTSPTLINASPKMYAAASAVIQTSIGAPQSNATTTAEVTSASLLQNSNPPLNYVTSASPPQISNPSLNYITSATPPQISNPPLNYVTSASPPQNSNTLPDNVTSNPSAFQNYYAANMSSTATVPVATIGPSTREVNSNCQAPVTSSVVPASTPSLVQEIRNVPAQNFSNTDRLLRLNIMLSRCIMSQLTGAPMQGGSVSMETLSAVRPFLPSVPQTTLADVTKPPPPPPVLDPNIDLLYAAVNPSQSASQTSMGIQPVPTSNPVFCLPPAPAGYAHIPSPRLPGCFIRCPSGRGRGLTKTLH